MKMTSLRTFLKWSLLVAILLRVGPISAQVNGKFWWRGNNIFGNRNDANLSDKEKETNLSPAGRPQFSSGVVASHQDYDSYEDTSYESDESRTSSEESNERRRPIPPKPVTPPKRQTTDTQLGPDVPIGNDVFQPPPLDGGSDCVCVEYYLCSANNTVITNGDGIVDVRLDLGPRPRAGEKCPGIQVCCGLPPGVDNPLVTPRIPPIPISEPVLPVTQEPPLIPPPRTCGVRGGNLDPNWLRILNDDDNSTQFGEFPWMLALLRAEERDDGNMEYNVFQCGAALIHPQVAVTAAHCVNSRTEKELKIRAGEWDTQDNAEPEPHQERFIAQIIKHKQFYSGTLYNDIALLIFDQPLDLAVNVQPVCLPQLDAVFDGSVCIATGWGVDAFGRAGKYQMTMKKVELPVVPHEQCQEQLRKSRLGIFYKLHDSFMCAGGQQGKDTCKGDGGGPLVCQAPGSTNYVQVGIVSWGIGCGENGIPAVYVNVPHFRNWIESSLAEMGIYL